VTATEASVPSPNGEPGHDDKLERSLVDQTLSDSDQTVSDTDQTLSDADQQRAERDQDSSDRDQRASDLEQAAADREPTSQTGDTETARADRVEATGRRLATTAERARTAVDRFQAADARDVNAQARDLAAAERDHAAEALEAAAPASGARQEAEQRLAEVRARAAEDRDRAAADRAAAAADRATAARDREQAAIELRHAHLDDLTGALRRQMGDAALQHEIDRAWRGDGRLVLAYVDVDGLKAINDRKGHSAGDALLVAVVSTMRGQAALVRPGRPLRRRRVRLRDVGHRHGRRDRRFVEVAEALAREHDEAAISVGVAELRPGDTLTDLVTRGDAALYKAKRRQA
jgi:GGDEF domain-containing protein